MKRLITVLSATLVIAACDRTTVAPESSVTAPSFAKGGAVVNQTGSFFGSGVLGALTGDATLTRNAEALWLTGQSPDLVEGDAYTVWAAIFENPNACVDGCDGSDLGVRAVQGTISNFGGFVADASGSFSIHLARHDDSRQLLGGLGKGGIDNPYRAEVHFIFRSHGTAETDPQDLAAQTSQVSAFCNLAIPPTPDGCDDQGLIVFLPPGAPGQG